MHILCPNCQAKNTAQEETCHSCNHDIELSYASKVEVDGREVILGDLIHEIIDLRNYMQKVGSFCKEILHRLKDDKGMRAQEELSRLSFIGKNTSKEDLEKKLRILEDEKSLAFKEREFKYVAELIYKSQKIRQRIQYLNQQDSDPSSLERQ